MMLSTRKIGGVKIGLAIMTPFSYLSIYNHDSCQDNTYVYSNPLGVQVGSGLGVVVK